MIDFQAIFRDPRWRPYYRFESTAPHRVYVGANAKGKIAALVVLRTRDDGDWPLGQRALDYVVAAERDGRIVEGHILLVDNKWKVIASARADEVVKRIGNAPPTTGPWGELWWLDSTFKPTAGYHGAGNDEKIPFRENGHRHPRCVAGYKVDGQARDFRLSTRSKAPGGRGFARRWSKFC